MKEPTTYVSDAASGLVLRHERSVACMNVSSQCARSRASRWIHGSKAADRSRGHHGSHSMDLRVDCLTGSAQRDEDSGGTGGAATVTVYIPKGTGALKKGREDVSPKGV